MPDIDISFEEIERMNLAATAKMATLLTEFEPGLMMPETDLNMFLNLVRSGSVLDIGCGWGRIAPRFTEAGLNYIGIDYSPEMLAHAFERHPKHRFMIMDYHHLDIAFEMETFDAVWSCCSLDAEPKRRLPEALEQIRHVLVPDGIAMFVLPCSGQSCESIEEAPRDVGEMYYSEWSFLEFGQALQDAGFHRSYARQRFETGSMTFVGKRI